MYNLPDFNSDEFQKKFSKILRHKVLQVFLLVLIIFVASQFAMGRLSLEDIKSRYHTFMEGVKNSVEYQFTLAPKPAEKYVSQISYEQAVINAVKSASPSVVSIVISKYLPVYEQQLINPFGENSPFDILVPQQVQKGSKYQEVGAGSGFIVSEDGLVLTNKHVVSDKKADYTVFTSDGKKYKAKVLALDPVQDLAIIKITHSTDSGQAEKFPAILLGDSNGVQIGQGAIAIGNALGQFSNTVSVGVVSGLGRTVNASDQAGSFSETLEGIIQTDAAINPGNSGGPLLNLKGEVIGVNTAMAQGSQSIGFTIPINIAKRDINQVAATNKIVYPFLGVRYVLIDEKVKEKYNLKVDYGALVMKGDNGESATTKDSPAQKADIREKDIVLELNGERVTSANSLAKIIQKYRPDDKVRLKVLRGEKEMDIEVVLTERS